MKLNKKVKNVFILMVITSMLAGGLNLSADPFEMIQTAIEKSASSNTKLIGKYICNLSNSANLVHSALCQIRDKKVFR